MLQNNDSVDPNTMGYGKLYIMGLSYERYIWDKKGSIVILNPTEIVGYSPTRLQIDCRSV